jgi:Transposase DDE domain group 1
MAAGAGAMRGTVMALVLLDLAGGESADDLRRLEGEEGFPPVLRRVELHGLSRRERRQIERRWREGRTRAVPSPSAVFRYLARFHEPKQEALRESGKAFIRAPNEHLKVLGLVNPDLVAGVQRRSPSSVATLDIDATLVECFKAAALLCYKNLKVYQPFNVRWAEHGLALSRAFHDGNVNAGIEQLRIFQDTEAMLPEGVTKLRMRSDVAGYQEELLRYCDTGRSARFGRIELAVSADVTPEFKKAVAEVPESDWKAIRRTDAGAQLHESTQQWTGVRFMPDSLSKNTQGTYRFIAVREALVEQPLPWMGEQLALSFQTLKIARTHYKLSGLVTNLDCGGEAVVLCLHERCGRSEEAYSTMKSDLAGGQLLSALLGANAAWWAIMLLALNLNEVMKRLVLRERWAPARFNTLRFHLIDLPGRLPPRGRQLLVQPRHNNPSFELVLAVRQRIIALAASPP